MASPEYNSIQLQHQVLEEVDSANRKYFAQTIIFTTGALVAPLLTVNMTREIIPLDPVAERAILTYLYTVAAFFITTNLLRNIYDINVEKRRLNKLRQRSGVDVKSRLGGTLGLEAEVDPGFYFFQNF